MAKKLVQDRFDSALKKALGKNANLDLLNRKDIYELTVLYSIGSTKKFEERAKEIYKERLEAWKKEQEEKKKETLKSVPPQFNDPNFLYYKEHGAKEFYGKRQQDYEKEYTLQSPADQLLVSSVIMAELRLMQLFEKCEVYVINNEVIPRELFKELQETQNNLSSHLEDLSLLKKRRQEGDERVKEAIADYIRLYEKYYAMPQKELLSKIRKEKIGATLTEEQIEEISKLREKIRRDEELGVPIPPHYYEAVKKNILTEPELLFIEHLRADPVYAARVLYGLTLDWYQKMILKSWWKMEPFYLFLGGRGTAKTFLGAVFSALVAALFAREVIVMVGPSFRQSSGMWDGASEIVQGLKGEDATIGMSALESTPTREPDQKVIKFKTGSKIIAIPLGQGEKIRGKRATRLMIEERQDFPDKILSAVVKPFVSVSQDPMQRVRLKKLGIDIPSAFSIVAVGTAGHEDTPFHDEFLRYMGRDGDKYNIDVITYKDPSPGFMNEEIIRDVEESSDTSLIRAEYLCRFVSLKGIFYPPQLIEEARSPSCFIRFTPSPFISYLLPNGKPGKQYFLGFDPIEGGQTTGDKASLAVFEYDPEVPFVGLVYLAEYSFGYPQEEANFLRQAILAIEAGGGTVEGLALELRGGGVAVKERLMDTAEVIHPISGEKVVMQPIVPIDSDLDMQGRRLIHGIYGSPELNMLHHSNFKDALRSKKIVIPQEPTTGETSIDKQYPESIEDIYATYITLRKQASTLVARPGRGGTIILKTPNENIHDDLVSASIRGYSLVYEMLKQKKKKKVKKPLILVGSPWEQRGQIE
ncbi:hypothetical protein [Pseudothermotoga sp.]|uniref:hypothetical protein n=1 Tax=Pseudothermotoga sp. TaxID=2033661 RepID=UPI000E9892FC|nr:hypothetical protein [Pseudothermotoga sp.]HBJ81670.1 hypothetical protein [Pseudothermotoga sp.]